jgi:hypothetical protein
MAIRRATQKAQVIEKLAEVAPPGETVQAVIHTETGPSPWLNAVFDRIPLVGLVVAFSRKFYFITLTNTSVVVNTASRWSNRPGEVVGGYPRDVVPITDVKRGTVWSKMRLVLPGHQAPTRLNIHRYWRAEFDQLLAIVPGAAADGQPAQQVQMPPQQMPPQMPPQAPQVPQQGQFGPPQGQFGPPQGQFGQPQQPPAAQPQQGFGPPQGGFGPPQS